MSTCPGIVHFSAIRGKVHVIPGSYETAVLLSLDLRDRRDEFPVNASVPACYSVRYTNTK